MSKRFALNLQHGERKKAKLDISVSDHHLPLSQNFSSSNKENNLDNWGDDNDDEMLLQASQACEQAISADTSLLPEYSMWEPPGSTSTQYQIPSTSKAPFQFKKPSSNSPSAISLHLKNKCSTISSPLPGIANKYNPETNGHANVIDDLIIDKGKDNTYNQILRLQEENEKLRAEYDKLQEKCVTKEGEASILRTQLKTCQMAVDGARMEKTRAQENVKIEYTEKLAAVKSQVADLQTQLEFKNLEILNVKEKCKKLESGKKLTQVIIPNHDISSRNNHSIVSAPFDSSQYVKRAHTTSNGVQTDHKAPFLKLNKTRRKEVSKISEILPHILQPTEQQNSLLDYNENLQKDSNISQNKCKVVSTFHRMPSTPCPTKSVKEKVTVSNVIDDLVDLATGSREVGYLQERYYHLFTVINSALQEVHLELEEMSRRLSTSFQKEMDERYIEATTSFLAVDIHDLLKGQSLYKDEQAVCARRLLAVLAVCLESGETIRTLRQFQTDTGTSLLDTALSICKLVDHCSVGVHYSGFLQSLCLVLEALPAGAWGSAGRGCVRAAASGRGAGGGAGARLLGLARRLARAEGGVTALCPGGSSGNLKVDYDQGLQLYKSDSCHFQIILKQTEVSLKCIERQQLESEAVTIVDHLTALCGTLGRAGTGTPRARCECQTMLVQVLIFSLRICTVMLKKKMLCKGWSLGPAARRLRAGCRGALRALTPPGAAGAGGAGALQRGRGALLDALDRLRGAGLGDLHENMLSELHSMFQTSPEDAVASFHTQPLELSFENFSMAD